MVRFVATAATNSVQMTHGYHQLASRLFGEATTKISETKAACNSYKLMLHYGLIEQASPGCYYLLPYAQRALKKLKRLINHEMHAVNAQEISVPCLTNAALWKKSGRWNTAGSELFTLKDRHDQSYCLGPTHEEAVTSLVGRQPLSPKKLPLRIYQISRKFRDEIHPKFGLLRGREFEMKDLYTFDLTKEKSEETYEEICSAYEKILSKLNVKYTKVAGDPGNIGGSLSHEYHIPADAGEDTLLTCDSCGHSLNKELLKSDTQSCQQPGCHGLLTESKGIEVAHSFLLGTKYSEVFNARVKHSSTTSILEMGCYGIGVTRLLAATLEHLSSDEEICWPRLIVPYQVIIIPQKEGYKHDVTMDLASQVYDRLNYPNEVVIDDRTHMSIGKRLIEAKRLGYPYAIILGKKALESPAVLEVVNVYDNATDYYSIDQLSEKLFDPKVTL